MTGPRTRRGPPTTRRQIHRRGRADKPSSTSYRPPVTHTHGPLGFPTLGLTPPLPLPPSSRRKDPIRVRDSDTSLRSRTTGDRGWVDSGRSEGDEALGVGTTFGTWSGPTVRLTGSEGTDRGDEGGYESDTSESALTFSVFLRGSRMTFKWESLWSYVRTPFRSGPLYGSDR